MKVIKSIILNLKITYIYRLITCKYNTILLFIVIINQNINAQSYFFNQEQSNSILEQLNKPKEKIKLRKRIKKKIEYKISGICYFGPNSWTVWINGIAYNKIGQYNNFSIDEVHPNSVTITTTDCKTMNLSVTCEGNNNITKSNK